MSVIGVDPGLGGGLVLLRSDGHIERCDDMPVIASGPNKRRDYDRQACWYWLMKARLSAKLRQEPLLLVLEQLQPMPRNGSIAAFKLGGGLELWATGAVAAGISLERVRPKKWQKAMGVGPGEKASLGRARELFPNAPLKLEKHSGRAAALLLAEYGRRHVQKIENPIFGAIL